jgi:hypothetical protein
VTTPADAGGEDALARAEVAYRAVIALPGKLGPEVCALVESQHELAGLVATLRAGSAPPAAPDGERPHDPDEDHCWCNPDAITGPAVCEVGIPPGKAAERRKCGAPAGFVSRGGMTMCDRHARYAHGPRKGQYVDGITALRSASPQSQEAE